MKIDKEIKGLIPALKEEEFVGLEKKVLKEGLTEPLVIWKEKDILLDGHHRLEICQKHNIEPKFRYLSFSDKKSAINWVIDNQLSRRNLDPIEASILRGKKYLLEKQSHGGVRKKASPQNEDLKTSHKIAKETGVSHATIERDAQLAEAVEKLEEIPKEVLKQNPKKDIIELAKKPKQEKEKIVEIILEKKVPIKKAIKEAIKEKERQKYIEKAKDLGKPKLWQIYHGDIQTIKLEKQFDFIITDPPYPKEFLPLYETLAKRSANEWLKDTGLLIVMCGQSYLDQIITIFKKYLDYYWLAAYLTPGQPTPLRQKQVNSSWKPLLIFTKKGVKYKGKTFGDVFKSEKPAKQLFKWQQSVTGMQDIIKQFCQPNNTILDPFCGTGSTGVAALKSHCYFEGIEINEELANIAKGRLHDTERSLRT